MKTGVVEETDKDELILGDCFREVHFEHGPGIDCGSNLGASSGAVPDGDGRAGFEEGQHSGQAHIADSNECDAGLCSHFQEDEELSGREMPK